MSEEKLDWFTHKIDFPKTGFVYFYAFKDLVRAYFFPNPYIFNSLEELADSACENITLMRAESISCLSDVLVVPLIFETDYPQKKSYWTCPKKSVDEYLVATDHLYDLNKNPDTVRAVVTCSYFDPQANIKIYNWACFYKASKNHTHLEKAIKASSGSADQQVKNFGIYQTLRPFGFDPFTQTIKDGQINKYKPTKLID